MIVSATLGRFVANIENLADFRVLDGELAEKDQAFSEFRADSMWKFMVWWFFACGREDCADLDKLFGVFWHLVSQPSADQFRSIVLGQHFGEFGDRLAIGF